MNLIELFALVSFGALIGWTIIWIIDTIKKLKE